MRKKRSESRFRQRLPVRLMLADRETTRFTGNVSPGGLLLLGRLPQKPGWVFDLAVDLPELGTARLRARLAWGKNTPFALESVLQCRFGAEVVHAPPAWYAWCRHLEARR